MSGNTAKKTYKNGALNIASFICIAFFFSNDWNFVETNKLAILKRIFDIALFWRKQEGAEIYKILQKNATFDYFDQKLEH